MTTSVSYANILKFLQAGADVVINYSGKILQLREIGASSLTFGAAEMFVPDNADYVTIQDRKIVLTSSGGTITAESANIEVVTPE